MSKKDKSDFPEKWAKKLPEGFKDTAESMSTDELQKEILKSEGMVADTEKEMDDDQKLNSLKEDLKLLVGAYKESINAAKAKTKYCLHLMRLRGVR